MAKSESRNVTLLFDNDELAVRILEATNGLVRVPNLTPQVVLATLVQSYPNETRTVITAAQTACAYFREIVEQGAASAGVELTQHDIPPVNKTVN